MSLDQWAVAGIRGLNLLLWVSLGIDLWRHATLPLPIIARRLIVLVIVGGMAVLFIGAFTPTYLPVGFSRTLYTAYTGFAAMVALAVWKTWR